MTNPSTRVLPDLQDELLHRLAGVEELLLTLSAWEDDVTADADGDELLPVPLRGRVALDALQRVWDAIAPTQTRYDRPPPAGGRLLGPDGRYEHRPLRLAVLDQADLDVLAAAAQVLGHTIATDPHSELADAIAAGTEAATPSYGETPTPQQLVEGLARALGVLDLEPTADTDQLRARLVVAGDADIVLTIPEETAYQRLADRFNTMWASSSALDRFLY